jgi:hypothetical protein
MIDVSFAQTRGLLINSIKYVEEIRKASKNKKKIDF